MTLEKSLNIEDIRKVLPHRYPFLLVDRVLSITADRVRAIKNVTFNEPFFVGHFPEMAVMPGVLQIEAMAQAAGLLLVHGGGLGLGDVAFLAGVDDARFKRLVVPGDQLLLEIDVIARKRSLLKAQAVASVDGALVSSATIALMTSPRL